MNDLVCSNAIVLRPLVNFPMIINPKAILKSFNNSHAKNKSSILAMSSFILGSFRLGNNYFIPLLANQNPLAKRQPISRLSRILMQQKRDSSHIVVVAQQF